MKKYFIFAAAAVTFVACTEDVLIDNTKAPENNNEVAIGFGSDINKLVMTRADDEPTAENSTGARGKGLENYHYTFRIWGYKNIKNPGTTTPATYTSTAVFDGTYNASATDNKYEKSIATWSWAANNTDPFNDDVNKLDRGDWVYSPVRYWDKTAYNYDFHAAAPDKDSTLATPAPLAWKWNQLNKNDVKTNWDPTKADANGAGYFTLENFTLVGESLPLANATVKPESGDPTYYNVTTQPNDVFGGKKGTFPSGKTAWEDKDVDLMIAEDVLETPTNHSSATNGNARVTFNFNHILSRLNIGVKIAGIAVKQMVTYGSSSTDTNEYLLYTDGTDNYIKTAGGKAQKVKLNEDNKTIENVKDGNGVDVEAQQWSDVTGIKVDDNVPNPTEGVVLLEDIEVVHLVTKGSFDEGVLAWSNEAGATAMNGSDGTDASKPVVTPTDLKTKGTNLRWKLASDSKTEESTDAQANKYAFPNEKVTGALDGDNDNVFNLSKKFTVGEGTDDETKYTKDDYKMVFQGLVIPQEAKFEDVPVDGSTKGTQPYIKIVYTLDGEEFTNYYNLAEVFSNVLDAYTITKENTDGTTTTYTAYFTDEDNVYVYYNETATDSYVDATFAQKTVSSTYYYDGTNYYEKESPGEKYKKLDSKPGSVTDAILKCTATLDKEATTEYKYTIKVLAPVTRKEADLDGVAETECDITFCEGWQNNLWITIHPTAILFDADVYKWDTKYNEYEYPVE